MDESAFSHFRGKVREISDCLSSHGLTLGLNFSEGVPGDIVSTYSQDWLDEYQAHAYLLHDPVVIWGVQFEGHRTWDELSAAIRTNGPDVISIARARGMRNGTSISVVTNRRKAIMGITHDAPRLDGQQLATIKGLMAAMLTLYDEPPVHSLTEKSLGYLRRVASGQSDTEIAHATGVTPRAVAALRDRTIAKLSAQNLAQAVLQAYKSRLLD